MQEIGVKPLIQTTRQTHSFFSQALFVHPGIYHDKGRKYHKYTLKPSTSNQNNPTPTHKNNISVLPLTPNFCIAGSPLIKMNFMSRACREHTSIQIPPRHPHEQSFTKNHSCPFMIFPIELDSCIQIEQDSLESNILARLCLASRRANL